MASALARVAARTREAAPAPTLDDRFVLTHLAMDDLLAGTHGDMAIRTAYIDTEAPEILAAPMPASTRPPVTVADVLREARRILADPDRGWCKRWLGDGVRACSKGAIREAAGSGGGLADKAETVLLDRIQAEVPGAGSIGGWNDAQPNVTPVLAMFDRAARHADRHGL